MLLEKKNIVIFNFSKKKRRNPYTIISITKIAMLHKEEPLERRFVKDSCPGVSIISKPGTLTSNALPLLIKIFFQIKK